MNNFVYPDLKFVFGFPVVLQAAVCFQSQNTIAVATQPYPLCKQTLIIPIKSKWQRTLKLTSFSRISLISTGECIPHTVAEILELDNVIINLQDLIKPPTILILLFPESTMWGGLAKGDHLDILFS